MPLEIAVSDAGFEAAFAELLSAKREAAVDVADQVAGIISDVQKGGDAALLGYTARFDRLETDAGGLRVSAQEIADARQSCDAADIDALSLAADRIRAFHTTQVPENKWQTDDAGVQLGYRWTPLASVGLYVPGGTAAYPSTVLMNALPARIAGVKRVVMAVPVPDGVLSPLVLAAAEISGVDEIYRIGGAQALAALAFGTETIISVDKLVGPGNAYVAAAKRQLFGTVGIDMIAGPSEILVVADRDSNPQWVAADLLSQAEHDVSAQSILMTDDRDFAAQVSAAIDTILATLPRADIAGQSWRDNGAIIVLESLDQAAALIDRLAPEHLELSIGDPDALADSISHAGAIFLGRYTPEVVGDYVGGPNHVLPTARSARFSSGLSVLDFMKRTSLLRCDADSLAAIGPAARQLARAEGLDAHALSVDLRLGGDTDRQGNRGDQE